MIKYAIVEIAGRHYKAEVGKELVVDKLEQGNGKVILSKVLLVVADSDIKIGTPTVSGAQVVATVLGQEKKEKIAVVKFRAKSRYRRKMGFRASLTRIKVEQISLNKNKLLGKTKTKASNLAS